MTAVIGADVAVDAVRPEDRQALDQFFDLCSRLTIYRRFFAPVRRFPDTYLDAVLAAPRSVHDCVVARCGDERDIVGLASLAAMPDAPQVRELGVLVADAWQGQGLGRAMVARLVEQARARGVRRLVASALPERAGLLESLSRSLELMGMSEDPEHTTAVYRIR
jgi:GNAT superfamily N-acetyltransferase